MGLGGGKINKRKGGERSHLDFYPTPTVAIKALYDSHKFEGTIWECASGDGAISKYFEEKGHEVYSSDLSMEDFVYGDKGVDFINTDKVYDNIITNPPYSDAKNFVEQAYRKSTKKVALLLRLAFLEGHTRFDMYQEMPPSEILIFCGRIPHWADGAWRYDGQFGHAWYIWDHAYEGKTQISWYSTKQGMVSLTTPNEK